MYVVKVESLLILSFLRTQVHHGFTNYLWLKWNEIDIKVWEAKGFWD